jgi:hypothetical protein
MYLCAACGIEGWSCRFSAAWPSGAAGQHTQFCFDLVPGLHCPGEGLVSLSRAGEHPAVLQVGIDVDQV